MRRLLIPLGVLLALIPVLLRAFSGHPWFAGTQAYHLMFLTGLRPWQLAVVSVACLAGAYAFIRALPPITKEKNAEDVAMLVLIVSPALLGSVVLYPIHAVMLLLLACAFWAYARRRWLLVGLALIAFIGVAHWSYDLGFSVSRSLVEFGGMQAYGLFVLIAALVGALALWESKARNYFFALAILLLVVVSFGVSSLVLAGTVVVSAVAGLGFMRLWNRAWTFGSIRALSLVVFACGLLFSSLVFVFETRTADPTGGLASDLSALRHALPAGKVVSSAENAPWITYWTGRETRVPPATFWQARSVDPVVRELENVSGILITEQMKRELWNDQEEGLLFVLNRSKTFKRIGSGISVEGWGIQ